MHRFVLQYKADGVWNDAAISSTHVDWVFDMLREQQQYFQHLAFRVYDRESKATVQQ